MLRRPVNERSAAARPVRSRGVLLFVYGTLRPGAGTPMAAWLAGRAKHLGAARTAGRLYDLGRYPGLLDARRRGEWVHGDLYRLRSPAAWSVLDDYENGASAGSGAEFVCVERAVEVPGRGCVNACLYLYRGPLRGARRIGGGDYLAASRCEIMPEVVR